jgi:Kef-type K+ transport system membrane component KefB
MARGMMSLLIELGIIIGIAAVITLIGRIIRQPPIIGYLLTGIVVGPLFLNIIRATEAIAALAHLGVALLLFIVGISLDFRVLRQIGSTAIVTGIATMGVIGALMLGLANMFGFSLTASLYLALAFSFSSTVIVVKILSDKKEIDTLHGRIALGILIIEDFIAALALMVIPVISGGDVSQVFVAAGKATVMIVGVLVIGNIVFPKILSLAARSQESLFLWSVAWAMGIAALFSVVGLSIEIGALLAGMVLASSKYALEVRAKIRGIRDFFMVFFFVYFGSQLIGPITGKLLLEAVVISGFITIGKPLVIMTLLRSFGFKKHTTFFTGASLAQVSEFSLIVILLGFNLGHLSQDVFSLGILVTLITVGISSYTLYFSQSLYNQLSRFLGIFDGKGKHIGATVGEEAYDVVLLGYNRVGFNLLKAFKAANKKYLVVEYNPITVLNLSKKGVKCVYGDVNDAEFLTSLNLQKAKIIISTIPDINTNSSVYRFVNTQKVTFIATAHDIQGALDLYKEGVDYVIMPHFLGGDFMAHMLVRDNFNRHALHTEGKRHIRELYERLAEGHEHPRKDFHGA